MLPIDLALCMISQAGLFGFYGYCVSVEQHVHIMTACGQQILVYVYVNEPTCLYPLYCCTDDRVQDVKVLYVCSQMMQLVASECFTVSFAFVTFTHLKYKYNNKRQGHDLPQGT